MRKQRFVFSVLRSNTAFQITNCKIRKKYGFDKFAKKGGILTMEPIVMATYNCRVLSSEDKLKLFSIKKHDRTWHCKVRRLSPIGYSCK